jgi:chemotaxis protein CheY-P-specific phosphatase CheC
MEQLRDLGGRGDGVELIRQSFFGGLSGEVLSIYTRGTTAVVVDLLGYDEGGDGATERELILDVSNLLGAAVLNGIGDLLDIDLGFSPPTLIDQQVDPDLLSVEHDDSWNHVLFTHVHFQLEEREFSSRLLIFLPDMSFAAVKTAVDRFLDEL